MPDRLAVPVLVLLALILVDLLVKVLALGLVPERRPPAAATAWLLVIFFVPVLGLLAFGLLRRHAVRRRRPQLEAQAGMIVLHNNVYPPLPPRVTGPDWLREVLALNARLGYLDPVAGNRVDLYTDDRATLAAMVADVAAAERFVHLECPVLAGDVAGLITALVAAAQRGVSVRLAYDAEASGREHAYAALVARMAGTNIERPMVPAVGHPRRSLLVVDGVVAFGGSSLLVADGGRGSGSSANRPCQARLAFRVEGPLAHSLSVVFAADWHFEGHEPLPRELLALPAAYRGRVVGQVVASGPGLPGENQLPMIISLVYGARTRVSVAGAFFTPDEPLHLALVTAARRGVAVELFVGTESDDVVGRRARQPGYAALLDAGVRIFRQPGRLADRHVAVDDTVAVVGSSTAEASAVSVLLLGAEVVRRFRAVEDGYRAASTEITLAAWRKRPLPQRYLDNVLRVVSALR